MASPGLAEGIIASGKAILRFSISDHRMGGNIGHPTIDRSCYRCVGLWHTDRCGLWVAGRLARYLYQRLVTGTAMASI